MKIKIGANVEVFKRDEEGRQVLVHTSRPCPVCGQPLDGIRDLVIPAGNLQVHSQCRIGVGASRRING